MKRDVRVAKRAAVPRSMELESELRGRVVFAFKVRRDDFVRTYEIIRTDELEEFLRGV